MPCHLDACKCRSLRISISNYIDSPAFLLISDPYLIHSALSQRPALSDRKPVMSSRSHPRVSLSIRSVLVALSTILLDHLSHAAAKLFQDAVVSRASMADLPQLLSSFSRSAVAVSKNLARTLRKTSVATREDQTKKRKASTSPPNAS